MPGYPRLLVLGDLRSIGDRRALGFQLDNAPGLFASADFKEGAAAFFEKRAPRFGLNRTSP